MPIATLPARPAQTVVAPFHIARPATKPAPLPVRQPDLSPLARLLRDADNLSKSRARSAELEGHLYEPRAYDLYTRTLHIQRADISTNPVYAVALDAVTCSCPDATHLLKRTNERLAAAGFCPSLTCKHLHIVNVWELSDEAGFAHTLDLLAREWDAHGPIQAVAIAVARAFHTDAPPSELSAPLPYSEQIARDFN